MDHNVCYAIQPGGLQIDENQARPMLFGQLWQAGGRFHGQ
jgi:hypothetical protein